MIKNTLFILMVWLTISTLHAQDNFLIGTWTYEKIPDHVDIDDEGLEIANEFFKDMKLSFDQSHYNHLVMGKLETGTYALLSDSTYQFNASKGYSYAVELIALSDYQLIFKQDSRELQFSKISTNPTIEIAKNTMAEIVGIKINAADLIGTWFYNGRIKNGKESDLILKHNETEIVNYTFLDTGDFINRSPFEIELTGTWSIDADQQTLWIDSDNLKESLKVVKLDASELYVYNPKNASVLKFKKAQE
ncbi:hypothetical protein [Sediminibacter sp. Hel_I_10]|uniref:hypothetical protein n=1 Tax=Sediminibacter sp. Hel_I_10 TaxID=1392490 RepID=UPI00047C4DC2|nr:hypothetical protein [Sediminibacter sp. Hel_I_10]